MPAEVGVSPDVDVSFSVLICDDFDAMRELLRAVVESAPTLRVIGEAADGAQAISEAERLQPDLILLDLAMPVMTGIEALPELRRLVPAARVIVISGFASSVVADEVLALGADGYVEKGANIGTILAELLRHTTTGAVPAWENGGIAAR